MEKSTLQLIFNRLKIVLFGYDFFISYRRSDSTGYAVTLREILSKDFICFLDIEEISVGEILPQRISNALKRSKKMILIASPNAATPPSTMKTDWIDNEIAEFKSEIIVINIENSLQYFKNEKIKLNPVFSVESFESLNTSNPSQRVLDDIYTNFSRARIKQKANQVFVLALLLMVLLFTSGVFYFRRNAKTNDELNHEKKNESLRILKETIIAVKGFKSLGFENYAKLLKDSVVNLEVIKDFEHDIEVKHKLNELKSLK